ncbi:ATPase, F1 complex, gamma subunit domain-containing protein [Zopfochytrium polystomum]|nr:ATPase, F1 complex, gamma subunit domain-containing protein [Zopfochytrium polystomum]
MLFASATSIARPAAASFRAAPSVVAIGLGQARNYATLKEIQLRLKSISNIEKITKSMKMIASTKVTKAQRAMESARVYGASAAAIYKHAETTDPEEAKPPVVVAVSSDRGLCGGIHSSISKGVKRYVATNKQASIAVLGMKARNQIQREYRSNIAISFDQVTKNMPTWLEAATIADELLKTSAELDTTGYKIFYNKFKSVIAFETTIMPVYNFEAISNSPKINAYEVDNEVLKNLEEFTFANNLYWAISEGFASEMAMRLKNAGEMIQKLTLTYNRGRQASITNELVSPFPLSTSVELFLAPLASVLLTEEISPKPRSTLSLERWLSKSHTCARVWYGGRWLGGQFALRFVSRGSVLRSGNDTFFTRKKK